MSRCQGSSSFWSRIKSGLGMVALNIKVDQKAWNTWCDCCTSGWSNSEDGTGSYAIVCQSVMWCVPHFNLRLGIRLYGEHGAADCVDISHSHAHSALSLFRKRKQSLKPLCAHCPQRNAVGGDGGGCHCPSGMVKRHGRGAGIHCALSSTLDC